MLRRMKEIQIIRRRRLRELLDTKFDGSQAKLADKIGRQADYISTVVRGKRPFGEKFARIVERSLGLPDGWLDAEEGAMFTSVKAARILGKLKQLPDGKQAIILAVIETMINTMEGEQSFAETLLKKPPLPNERAAELIPPAPKVEQ